MGNTVMKILGTILWCVGLKRLVTPAIITAFDASMTKAKSRGWGEIFIFSDIHDTIIKPNYKAGDIPTEFYPHAKEALQMLSERRDMILGLYTCSHPHEIEEYLTFFKSHGINFEHVNENTDVVTEEGGYGCYDKKPYFNVLMEDKCGFDAKNDWIAIIDYLDSTEELKENKN